MVPQSLIPLLMMSVCSNYMGEDYVEVENEDEPRFLGCILNEPPPLINKKFVIATLRDPPLSDMDENGKGVGIIFDFIEILRKKFGFTYTVKVPKENIIGNKEIGVLSMVHRGEADIAAAFLPVLPENMEVAKLSFSLGEAEWVILMRRPSESANGSGLFAPFDTTVWLLILTSLILVGPAIFIIIMIRVKLCKGSETLTRVYPLDACVWFVYGALMKQGSTLSPVADSSRLLFATWWIFITILTSFYTANLTAFLTLSRFTLPIDDARGVAKYRYRWIGHKGFALDQMVATDPGYEYLNYSKRRGYGEFVTATNDEMMKKVDSRNVMYLRERNVVEHLMLLDYLDKTRRNVDENKRCTFVITPKEFMRPPIAIAYTRNSTLNKLFDPVIMSLVETGIIKHLMKRHLPSTKICPLDLGSKERQLRNSDLFMTYIIVMSGYAVAVIVFLAEYGFRVLKKFSASRVLDTHDQGQLSYKKSHLYPPPYSTVLIGGLGGDTGKRQNINGRDYMVVNAKDGDTRLIPMRTPSAFLFQYAA